jgi:acetylornithine/N-succinyldiaminopimelate aminotransferase
MNLFDVYHKLPLTLVSGNGAHVSDENGKQYLDFYGGHAVISIGHQHPRFVERISSQLAQLAYYSNAVELPVQQELAAKMAGASGYPNHRVFLCNSGAEANENALKVASQVTGKQKVIAFEGSFHGRTAAALAIADQQTQHVAIHSGFDSELLPLNDQEALQNALSAGDCCAVIIEGIQGVAGVIEPDASFLEATAQLCKKYSTLLILDEVQSGCGRTGKYFAHQHVGSEADIITMAKGIGNGFPVAGLLISPHIKAEKGMLGSTFGGNPLACAAALAVLEVMESDDLVNKAAGSGAYLKSQLDDLPGVVEVRGKGLMLGIEFEFPVQQLRNDLLDEGVITGSSGTHVLRLLPPLNINQKELDQFIDALQSALQKIPSYEAVH